MADRYQGKRFPADDYDRGGDQYGSAESDPLAELARLIGQTDPFGNFGKSQQPPPVPRAIPRDRQEPRYEPPQYEEPQYDEPVEDEPPAAGPPAWMQRANARAVPPPDVPPQQDHPSPVHPLQRYAAQQPLARYQQHQDYENYSDEPAYEEAAEQADPSRYDEALYGRIDGGAQDFQRDPAYPDDPYAYQDGYEDESEDPARKRRGGLLTVVAVLALAVVGTGAAFAYRTYMGSPKGGDPPIIKADNTPTKMVPAPVDTASKTPDRMPAGDSIEKIISREEKPVDVNANTGAPRVVFPPLTPNGNPPPPAAGIAVATPPPQSAPPAPSATNGTLPSAEPHKIKTFSVRGDQADAAAVPVPPPAPAAPAKPTKSGSTAPHSAPQVAANAPLSLAPDAQASAPAPEPRRVAAVQPQVAPGNDAAPAAEGRFLVSITSQPTEAEAEAAFRSMQKKHPDQLSSRSPVIKRVDGKKGVAYRALVGPFASREEAKQFCTTYSSAGGQCWVP